MSLCASPHLRPGFFTANPTSAEARSARTLRAIASLILVVACVGYLAPAAVAQTFSFNMQEYPVAAPAQAVDEADFNHDGISDLVTADRNANTVSVLLGQGQGKFGAPVHFATGASPIGVIGLDVNHDGKFDIVTVNQNGNSVSILLGNGDGTFAAARDIAVGQAPNSITAGDFNEDGNVDLAVANGASKTISLLRGDGTGNFSVTEIDASHYDAMPPQVAAGGTFSSMIGAITVGDFNADGKSDLAYVGCCANLDNPVPNPIIRVLAGDGAGGFTTVTQVLAHADTVILRAADINHDGFSDLLAGDVGGFDSAIWSDVQLFTNTKAPPYFGSASFSYGFADTPLCVDGNCSAPLAPHAADFNGDGIDDIAVLLADATKTQDPGSNYPYDWPYDWLVIFPGKADGSFGAPQAIEIHHGSQGEGSNVTGMVLKDFDKDGKLDIAIAESKVQSIAVLLNSTGAACAAPSSDGIHVCSPAEGSTTNSPVHFSASFTLPGTPYRFEVWNTLTGEKLVNVRDSNVMDTDVALAAGDYSLTFIARDTLGNRQQAQVHFTVGQSSGTSCPAPSSDGVNVCAPSNNATVGSPVDISAGATVTGGVYRFELWVDGTKAFTVRDSGDMRTSVAMSAGSHKLEFVAQNASGTHVSATRTITVSGTAACTSPTAPGVVVCTPADYASVPTTFGVEAYANVTGGVYRFELWASGTKLVTVRDSGGMKASVTLAPGSYTLEFVAQNTDGSDREVKSVHVTVN